MITRLLIAFICSLTVAAVAWRGRALTFDGAAVATLLGTLILDFGGWPMAVVMVAAFSTSSALTRWQAARKSHPEHRRGRSAAQVIANGAVATALAVGNGFTPTPWIITAFAGSVAALAADTWATEVGLVSSQPSRLITSGRPVERGRSGGVTVLGTVAGIAGAALIGAIATQTLHTPFVPVWVGGAIAMLVDSLLGATVEGRYRGVGNDAINFIVTTAGAGIAMVLAS